MRQTTHLHCAARRVPAAIFRLAIGCWVLLAAATGCSDRDKTAPIGLGSLEPGRFEEIVRSFVAASPDSDRYTESVSSTGDATTLYVGHFGTRRMRSLVHFGPLRNAIVRDARVYLRVSGSDGPEAPLTIGAHRVRTDWNEITVEDSFPPAFDDEPIATAVSAPGESLLSFDIPDTLVTTWMGDVSNNRGLLLAAVEQDSTLRKFGSSEGTAGSPFLRLVLDTGGGSETIDTVFADRDAYLTQPDLSVDGATTPVILVGRHNGFTYRSTLFFRIPEGIDESSTVNFATMTLKLNPAESLFDTSFVIGAHAPVGDTLDVFLAVPEAATLVTSTTDTLSFALTDLVSRLRRRDLDTLRVLVRATIELADSRLAAFYSEEGAVADSSLSPRMHFIVSSPAGFDTISASPIAVSGSPEAPAEARKSP